MRKRILAFAFAGGLLLSITVPVFGGGVASALHPPGPPEKVEICHKGKTLTLPHQAAASHLANHSGDRAGRC